MYVSIYILSIFTTYLYSCILLSTYIFHDMTRVSRGVAAIFPHFIKMKHGRILRDDHRSQPDPESPLTSDTTPPRPPCTDPDLDETGGNVPDGGRRKLAVK